MSYFLKEALDTNSASIQECFDYAKTKYEQHLITTFHDLISIDQISDILGSGPILEKEFLFLNSLPSINFN